MLKYDFRVEDHGSIALVHPLTEKGKRWMYLHAPEDTQWCGNAMVIEPRYVATYVEIVTEEGFTIH
jgi:hypothetical protein